MAATNRPVLDGFVPDDNAYHCELHYEGVRLRIRVICTVCGAEHIGNADDVKRWQSTHACGKAAHAS